MDERHEGTVKWFNNDIGYGFILEDGKEYFVHFSGIQMEGYKSLKAMQEVEFSLKETDKGVQAVEVVILSEP